MKKFRYFTLAHAELFVFENYIIQQVYEGAVVTVESGIEFKKFLEGYYGNKKVVYLTNRVNKYAVEPVVYMEVAKIPQLVGIGIISRDQSATNNAKFEKQFYSKPFKILKNMREAIDWADDILQEFPNTDNGKNYADSK